MRDASAVVACIASSLAATDTKAQPSACELFPIPAPVGDSARAVALGIGPSGSLLDVIGREESAAIVMRLKESIWVFEQLLTPSDYDAGDRFGASVAIENDVIVVGADFDDAMVGHMAGSAYVFRHDGLQWIEERKLLPLNAQPFDSFGGSAAIYSGTIVAGGNGVDSPWGKMQRGLRTFSTTLAENGSRRRS